MRIADTRTSRRHGAILSMELVLVLPIFLMLVFSVVEFSMLMSARTRVANAAYCGSRLMSLTGVSTEQIHEEVASLLGPALSKDCVISVHSAKYAGDIGRVTVNVPMKNASPDLLWITGFSLSNRTISTDAPMVMERSASASVQQTY